MADVDQAPEKLTFSLKPVESQLLSTIQQQMTIMVTNALSFIAIERLNYQVTAQTNFEVAKDMKSISLWEQPAEPEVATAETTSDTAKAIKGHK